MDWDLNMAFSQKELTGLLTQEEIEFVESEKSRKQIKKEGEEIR